MLRFFLVFFIAIYSFALCCQPLKVVYEYANGQDSLHWSANVKYHFQDNNALSSYLKERQEQFYEKGYLLASVSRVNNFDSSSVAKVMVSMHRKISAINIFAEKVPKEVLLKAGLQPVKSVLILNPAKFLLFKKSILDAAANLGFPFAKVALTNNQINENSITAHCVFIPGDKIYFDSVYIKGDVNIDSDYLARYLDIKTTNPQAVLYKQSLVDGIPNRLEELPYLSLEKPPNVLFRNGKAVVELRLKKVKVNKIDGLLGVLPNSNATGRTLLNGFLDVHLQNPFGKGKELVLKWIRTQRLSPIFKIAYKHPQFLKSNYHVHFQLSSLQQDSIFRNLDWQLGISKRLLQGQEVGFFYKGIQSVSLRSETADLPLDFPQGTSKLNANYIGIFQRKQKYGSGNKKGLEFGASLGFGNLNYSILDSIQVKGVNQHRFTLGIDLATEISVNRTFSYVNEMHSEIITGPSIFLSELHRLGGFASLRGFDENFFYTPFYILSRNELRMSLEDESFFYLFGDFSVLKERQITVSDDEWLLPIGFGLGIDLKIQSGYLKLATGLGINGNNELTLRKARFHFGYTAVF